MTWFFIRPFNWLFIPLVRIWCLIRHKWFYGDAGEFALTMQEFDTEVHDMLKPFRLFFLYNLNRL